MRTCMVSTWCIHATGNVPSTEQSEHPRQLRGGWALC
jgi:hypothetical protein